LVVDAFPGRSAATRQTSPKPAKRGGSVRRRLGHKKLDTTALYTRVAVSALGQVTSPLDFLLKMPG
jgi:hypothetical protein